MDEGEGVREIRIVTKGVRAAHATREVTAAHIIYTVRPEGEEWIVYDNGRRTNLAISYPYSFDRRALGRVMRIEAGRNRRVFDTEPIERIEKYGGDSEEPFEVHDVKDEKKEGNHRTIVARTRIVIGAGAGAKQKL